MAYSVHICSVVKETYRDQYAVLCRACSRWTGHDECIGLARTRRDANRIAREHAQTGRTVTHA